jgi:hypothetical protein
MMDLVALLSTGFVAGFVAGVLVGVTLRKPRTLLGYTCTLCDHRWNAPAPEACDTCGSHQLYTTGPHPQP